MNKYLIVNFDRKEFLRPEAFGEKSDLLSVVNSQEGVLLGLVVLLSDSNNRGGGDLRSDAEIIGSWAGNRIALVDDAVTLAALCEPGMQAVPLQQQVLTLGRDVSKEVIAAIIDGEGDYCILKQLNDRHVLNLVEQRSFSEDARKRLLDEQGRNRPFEHTEQMFEVLGVSAGLSPFMAKRRLQEGIDKMSGLFGLTQRVLVTSVAFSYGLKTVKDPYGRPSTGQGVVSLHIEVSRVGMPGAEAATAASDGATRTALVAPEFVEVNFGPKGTTTAQLYKELLGVTTFEAPREAIAPEAAAPLTLNSTTQGA